MRSIRPFVIIALLVLLSGVGLQFIPPAVVHASTSYTWTGKGDGVHWSDGNNWSPNGVPGAQSGDDVTIAPGQLQAFPDVTLGTSVSLQSLTLKGSSDLHGGSLTVSSFNWTGDSTSDTSFLGTPVTVAGTATITGANSKVIQTPDGTTIPTLTLQGNTTLSDTRLQTNSGRIVNTGTFTAQTSSTITAWVCCANLDQFVNQGTFIIPPSPARGPKVTISGMAFNDQGSVNIGSNSTLELQIAPSTFASGVSFTGAGTLLINNNANVQLSGSVNLGSGTTFLLGLDQNNSAGMLSGTGTLSGSGSIFSWTGGTINGTFTIASSVNTTISGNQQKLLLSPDPNSITTLTLAGHTTLSSSSILTFGGNEAILNNTGTFSSQAGSIITAQGCCANPAQFNNKGTLNVSVGAGKTFSVSEVAFNNSGTVNLKSGTLQFGDPGYVQTAGKTVLDGGSLASTSTAVVHLQGGKLIGNGTITATVLNQALVDPGNSPTSEGIIKISGDYYQTSTGTLRIDIMGTTPGSGYDQLAVTRAANLVSGKLDFEFASGFTPTGSDSFSVITFATRNGQFPKLQSASANPTQYWVQYQQTAGALFLTGTRWGVDSKGQITSLYSSVQQTYGTPDFWGRYIGDKSRSFKTGDTTCTQTPVTYSKDIVTGEVTEAHSLKLAILPVYFNYDPTIVNGKTCGQNYARAAIEFAQHWAGPAIPQGTAIFVDIEYDPAKYVVQPDAAFIQGWYDQFQTSFSYMYNGTKYTYNGGDYKAGYYADTDSTANFDTPYCTAVSQEPQMATNSFIWTDRPGLSRSTKANAQPYYMVIQPPCGSQTFAWQYGQAPANSPPPNVDTDEAVSGLPLWNP